MAPKLLERRYDPRTALALMHAGYPSLLARLYAARGIASPSEVIRETPLPYELLKGAKEMAALLADAIEANKRLLIVADYDCDGATACAVGMRALKGFGANVGYLVPDRMQHGYGLTPSIVMEAASLTPKPDIIVTVDNGIASHAGVAKAHELGMQVYVTDHHLPAETLPDAEVIVNPNQPGCAFPSKALAGCGVMWYVCWALEHEMLRRGADVLEIGDVFDLLPLVAIGTVADVVRLDDNNRTLVHLGITAIRSRKPFAGIAALCEVGKRRRQRLTTADIAFGIGPRINAAGRLERMDTGIEALLTDDFEHALALAALLDSINDKRKQIEAETVVQAASRLITEKQRTICLYDAEWHPGVIGIVAGRIRETMHRPTLVFCGETDGALKASGRSIPGFHLRDALDLLSKRHPELLEKFGGHSMAAGLTLRPGKFEQFCEAFERIGQEWLTEEMLCQTLETDGTLDPDEFTLTSVRLLETGIWGQGFPEPVFTGEFDVVRHDVMKDKHTKLLLKAKGAPLLEAVRFNWAEAVPQRIRAAFKLSENDFRNEEPRLQLLIEHLEAVS